MSWKIIKQAFKNPDMRKRILYVVAMILVFRALSHVPVPIGESGELRSLLNSLFNSQQLLGFLDILSGGALSNFSIVLMGLGPYINASIIMQLLTRAIPRLEALNKEGEVGRRKINQYTRLLALPLSILQSIGFLMLIRQQASGFTGTEAFTGTIPLTQWVLMITALTGGSMLLMWLGELMSEQGVGNGISILIFAGIVSTLPGTLSIILNTIFGADATLSVFGWFSVPVSGEGLIFSLAILLGVLLVTYWVVKLNEAQRILTVSYAKRVRGNRAYGGVNTVLPIKLIIAGVIPIIFAVAFLAVPNFLGQLLINADSQTMANIGARLTEWFGSASFAGGGSGAGVVSGNITDYIYPASYFFLVVLFTYFYTGIMFNSKEIAENLQKQGGFIAGIRPGANTEAHLKKIVNRLTLFGAIALGLLAILPFIIDVIVFAIYRTQLSSQFTIGGTSLLITVAVAIETLRQVESRALMVTYDAPEDE